MKLPKLLRNRQDAALSQAREWVTTRVENEAKAYEMSHGRPVTPVHIDGSFTDAEKRLLPSNMTPWIIVEVRGARRMLAFSHYEIDGEDLVLMQGTKDQPNVVVLAYREDGSAYPCNENQTMVRLETATPAMLLHKEIGGKIAIQVIHGLLTQRRSRQEGQG